MVISFLPFDNSLKHIYDFNFFRSMKKNSFFINLGRGMHVNENDLIDALKLNLAAAAIDVFEKEPLEENSKLYKINNLILVRMLLLMILIIGKINILYLKTI